MSERFGNTLIVAPVESMQKGDTFGEYEPLPLHITIQPWFELASRQAFLNSLANDMYTYRGFDVVRGDEADFGKTVDLVHEANRADIGKLNRLHEKIGQLVTHFGGVLNPSVAEREYRPHVSQVQGRQMPGQFLVDGIQIVYRQDDGNKLIGHRYAFMKGR